MIIFVTNNKQIVIVQWVAFIHLKKKEVETAFQLSILKVISNMTILKEI